MQQLYQLLQALALLAAFSAPLLAGRVVCTSDSGHRAIELAHAEGSCPESESESCHDENISVDIHTRVGKLTAVELDQLAISSSPLIALPWQINLPPTVVLRSDHPPAVYSIYSMCDCIRTVVRLN